MKAKSPLELLTELMTDIQQIQAQLARWLPILAARAVHPGLRHLIVRHASESALHLKRIDLFFADHQQSPAVGISRAINLIISDSDDNLPDASDPERSDLVLLIQILRVEQYEITYYEIVAKIAEQLGFSHESEMLAEFLAERDASADILRKLQGEMIKNAFPTEIVPDPPFPE